MIYVCSLRYYHFLSLAKALLFLLIAHRGSAQEIEEIYSLLGPGAEIGSATVDASGNFYLFGRLDGTVDFDLKEGTFPLTSDGVDLFIAKYDADGNRQYAKRIRLDLPQGRSVDPGEISADADGNLYICGSYQGTLFFEGSNGTVQVTNESGQSNGFVAKYDAVGNNVFYYTWPDQGDIPQDNFASSTALASDGYLYVLGLFRGTIDFNPTNSEELVTHQGNSSDLFLTKYTTDGTYVKTIILGGTDYEAARRIEIDDINNIVIAGHFDNRIRLDPNSSSDTFVKDGIRSFFVAKYNSDMELLYARPIYGAADSTNQALEGRIRLSVDNSRNIYVAGLFRGALNVDETQLATSAAEEGNFFIAKYTAGGDLLFARQYGGPGYEENREFTVDDIGTIYLSGVFRGSLDLDTNRDDDNRTSAGEEDAFLAKFTSEGEFQSVVHFSSDQAVLAKELFRFGDTLYFVSNFSGIVQVDNNRTIIGSPIDEDRNDAFIVKYEIAPPTPPPARVSLATLSRYSGQVGDDVVLLGENFGQTIDDNIVLIGDAEADVSRVNEERTEITIQVPDVAEGSYIVSLQVGDTIVVADRPFLVTSEVAQDEESPEIVLSAPGLLNEEVVTFAVSGEVVDASGVGNVTLEFLPIRKNPDSDDWRKLSASREGTTNTYIAQLTETDLDELGVQTRIIASDVVGNTDTSAIQYTFRNYTAEQPLGLSGLQATGEEPSANDYNLVAIPLQGQTVRQAFSPLGEYDTRRWRAWQLGEEGAYQEYSRGWGGEMQAGRGYMLIYTAEGAMFQSTGRVVEATYDQPFTLTLEPGFTLIGNPYPFALDWSQVLAYNELEGENLTLKTFDEGFREASRLEAFQGGLVTNPNEGQVIELFLPVGTVSSVSGRSGQIAEPQSSADWQLTLSLRSEELSTQGVVGMHSEAQVGVDGYDDFAVPRLADFPQLISEHEEFFLPALSRDMVGRASHHAWEWQVVGQAHEVLTLHWDAEEVQGLDGGLWLVDEGGVRQVDMRAEGQYRVQTDGEGRYALKVVYGAGAEVLDGSVQVGLVYPNPMREEMRVPVKVGSGEKSRMMLEVVDVTGRVVDEQVYEDLSPGYHTLTWKRNATHNTNSIIPSGIYFFKLKGQTTVTGRFAIE